MATEAVSGALLFAFLQVSIERLASKEVKNFFSGKDSIVKRLKELSTALTSARKVLDHTEGKRIIDQTVKKQLDDLQEAVYDADDLVYKIHTEASQNQREGESPKRFLQVRRFINPNTFEKEIKLEIDEILRKLKVAEKELGKRLPAAPLVEESNVYGRDADKEDIIPNYDSLPSHLKSCFAYCALFPKDYKFVKEKVILLWMAEGLLHTEDEKRMEEVGEEYIQDLISKSFFQPSGEDESAFVRRDLATSVLGEFSLQMDDINFYNCAHKIRHFPFSTGSDDPKKFEALSKAKGLRTFLRISKLNSGERWSLKKEQLLETLLHTWGCLRVLSVSGLDIIKLPDSIGDLKYLRYLDLSHTEIEEVPEIVCNLYNLQTLLLDGCLRLTRLPTNIGNLINLRHLHTPPNLKEMPEQLDKLTNLQTLSEFVVSKNKECGVKLLDELKGLRGTLHISRLENVADVDEVSKAKLMEKELFSKLILEWGPSHKPDDKESKVLEALKPHTSLKEIDICNYFITSFPNWVGDHSFSNVVKVRLFDCKKCSSLPPLGQLHSLKHLIIRGFHGVETIDSEFYSINADSSAEGTKSFESLEILHFLDMPKLRGWSFKEGEVDGGFPRLKELELRDCPKLEVSLPTSLTALRKLVVDDCAQLEPLGQTNEKIDDAFPSLETLNISRCDGQKSLLKGGLPKSLTQICIVQCWELEALDDETFQHLTSLEKLQISFCDKLERLPRSGLPTSLSYLSIESCSSLTPKLQRETGEDWPKIANIQILDIRSHPLFK